MEQLPLFKEFFENIYTGVEAKYGGNHWTQLKSPWDPTSIRMDTRNFSLRNILDMIHDGDLILDPDFQRNRVWKNFQKSRLIESILLRIPLPSFYFMEDNKEILHVVDGLQRLSSVLEFTQDSIELCDTEYLHDQKNKSFSNMAQLWKRRLYNTQISAHIITNQTPAPVKFDIFKRINTGASSLNTQEIRHCMSKQRSREFLKSCARAPSFLRATNYDLKDHIRMVDRNLVLRFIAFRQLPKLEHFSTYGSFNDFLNYANYCIDEEYSDEVLEQLAIEFNRAMDNSFKLFGIHAFRKWPAGNNKIFPINRALFESWATVLADYEWSELGAFKEAIVTNARQFMKEHRKYIQALSSSAGDFSRVRLRFEIIQEILEQHVGNTQIDLWQ